MVYSLRFSSSILHECKKRLIGHMPNNKYSINVCIKAFFAENGQLVALENALVAIHCSNVLLASHFEEYF